MRVLNKHHYKNKPLPENTVYIGRGSKWGNPYSHMTGTKAEFKVNTREEAIDRYREYLSSNRDLMESLHEIKGKNLLCYCSPKQCHGNILIEVLESTYNDTEC